jgi:hypothetical protein
MNDAPLQNDAVSTREPVLLRTVADGVARLT